MDTLLKQLASTPENVSLTDLLSHFGIKNVTHIPTNTMKMKY